MVIVRRSSLIESLARVTTADKFVNNRFANLLGCQPARAVAAAAVISWRQRRAPDGGDIAQRLERDGVVLVANYVEAGLFAALQREVEDGFAVIKVKRPQPDKFGLMRQQVTLQKFPEHFPLSHRVLLYNEDLLRVIRYYEGWRADDTFEGRGAELKYERLEQMLEPSPVSPDRDDENSSGDMHSDTFHRVTKAFLTLSPMTAENSPYTYCVGTQRVSSTRLLWEYRNSIRPDQYAGDEQFRRRLFAREMERMGLRPTPLIADANTLVLTDTSGFHLRGRMTRQGALRKMLRMDFRSDPFRA